MRIPKTALSFILLAWSCAEDKEASSNAVFTLSGYSCNVGEYLSKYTFDAANVSCTTEGPAAPDEINRIFHTCDFREETAIDDSHSYGVVTTKRTSDGAPCEIVAGKNTVKFEYDNLQLTINHLSPDNSQTTETFACQPIEQRTTSVSFTKCSEAPLVTIGIGRGLRRAPADPDAFCWLPPREYKANYIYFYEHDAGSIRDKPFFNPENCFFKNDPSYDANLPRELFEFSCRANSGSQVTYVIGSVDDDAPTHDTYVKLCEQMFSQLNIN